MKFIPLDLEGVWLIEAELISDARGVFRRHFCFDEFKAHGLEPRVMQGNVSENPHFHTLRGFHYQLAPHSEGKTISCFSGALYDIIVDLRPSSRSFLKWISVSVDADSRSSIYVPPGCANAYLTMSPNTVVHYYMSEVYASGSYRGFSYKDPSFGFRWPVEPKVISERDNNLPNFDRATLIS